MSSVCTANFACRRNRIHSRDAEVLELQGYNLASRRPMGEIRIPIGWFEDPTRISRGVIARPYQAG